MNDRPNQPTNPTNPLIDPPNLSSSRPPTSAYHDQTGLRHQGVGSLSEAMQIALVTHPGRAIRFFKSRRVAAQLAAAAKACMAFFGIRKPTDDIDLEAVGNHGWLIQYIENPSEAFQLAAVQQTGYALRSIKNPTHAVQLTAFARIGAYATNHWTDDFRPTAAMLATAARTVPAQFGPDERYTPGSDGEMLQRLGFQKIANTLKDQPSTDILDLAAEMPELFTNDVLAEVLRDALHDQSYPSAAQGRPRLM